MLSFILLGFSGLLAQHPNQETETVLKKMSDEIMLNGNSYHDLVELVGIGPRLTGSDLALKAVDWAENKMKSYGFDRVYRQPVMVPKWERGNIATAAANVNGKKENLKIVALGRSVGTPKGGLEAEVIEVKHLSDLDKLGSSVKGKIVFFNRPFDETVVSTLEAYGGAVDQRSAGPSRAAKYGAVATIARSMTNRIDDHPHTGMLRYDDNFPKIPAAAITTQDAEKLSRLISENPSVKISMEMNCQNLPDVLSYNVIGEIKGSEFPDEIIVVGGHLDSWDLSVGAQDDGAGCVQSIEVLNTFKKLAVKPKRTLRAVMFMSEEVGGIGGKEYAVQAEKLKEKHIAAMESDLGGFTPRGIEIQANEPVFNQVTQWKSYFKRLKADDFEKGSGGVDIGPLSNLGVSLFGLIPDSQRYFDIHHSDNDDLSTVNPRELKLGAVVMTQLVYLLSENGLRN